MKHFLYHIIGEVILTSLLIFSTICLYNQAQIINKQREFIDELQFKYYKLEEYKEDINLFKLKYMEYIIALLCIFMIILLIFNLP